MVEYQQNMQIHGALGYAGNMSSGHGGDEGGAAGGYNNMMPPGAVAHNYMNMPQMGHHNLSQQMPQQMSHMPHADAPALPTLETPSAMDGQHQWQGMGMNTFVSSPMGANMPPMEAPHQGLQQHGEMGGGKKRKLGEENNDAMNFNHNNIAWQNSPPAGVGDDGFDQDDDLAEPLAGNLQGFGSVPLQPPEASSLMPKAMLRVPEAIKQIASVGKALHYDAAKGVYLVIDGTQFELEFQALRVTRDKKNQESRDRPFSSMCKHFILIQGEKWAGTGSIFAERSKGKKGPASQPSPSDVVSSPPIPEAESRSSSSVADTEFSTAREMSGLESDFITADRVLLQLADEEGKMQKCSLQHFLEVTGAGELFKRSLQAQGHSRASVANQFDIQGDELDTQDIFSIVGGVWNADSKGDQAYFFKRKGADSIPFRNGAIVALVGGEVVPDNQGQDGMFMVVSDNNAKWKGEPIPTPEEEAHGHWCAFLGQVPVVVDGAVKCGDHIGPKLDGSGFGKKVQVGQEPSIGIALVDKSSAHPAILKVLVFAGFNALSQNSGARHGYGSFLDKVLEEQMKELTQQMGALQTDVRDMQIAMDGAVGQQMQLEERLNMVEENIVTAIPLAQIGKKNSDAESAGAREMEAAVIRPHDIEVGRGVPSDMPDEKKNLTSTLWQYKLYLLAAVCLLLVVVLGVTLGVVLNKDNCPVQIEDHFDMQITCPGNAYRELDEDCRKELNFCSGPEQHYCLHCGPYSGGPKKFYCIPGGHFTVERCNWEKIKECEASEGGWSTGECADLLLEDASFDYYAGYTTD